MSDQRVKTPKTLKDVWEMMPDGYDSVAVEIVGKCNAKCKYCPACKIHEHGLEDGDFITPKRYEEILKKLIEYRFFGKNTAFHIYRLGEPCLHPQLNEILKITAKYDRRTVISTNASKLPDVDAEGLEGVSRVLLSMPGFSQESYDKIHGFRFETIKKNIVELKRRFDELSNGRIPFDLSFHIYQFNQNELTEAAEFCKKNGIRFAPNYAVLMDKNKCMQYVTGKMSYEELKDISKELFLGVLDHQIEVSPRNYCDFQERYLSLTQTGEVMICTAYTNDWNDRISCGNLLTDPIDAIIERKYSHERCKSCIAAGLTLAKGYDCKVFPDYYYSVMKENEYRKEVMRENIKEEDAALLENEIVFMHTVRSWEEAYDENVLKELLPMIPIITFDKAQDIVRRYCRFPNATLERLSDVAKEVSD